MAVNAGPDQVVEAGHVVGVEAVGSVAPVWSQTAGPAVTLAGAGARRTFTAPVTMAGAVLTFQATAPTGTVASPAGANPGAEADTSSWSVFGATASRDTSVQRSGAASLRVAHTQGQGYSQVGYYLWLDSYGAPVTVRVHLRTDATIPATSAVLSLVSRDGNWAASVKGSTAITPTGNVWEAFDVTGTPDTADAEIWIELNGVTGVPVYHVDDVQFLTSEAPSSDSCTVTVRPHDRWRRTFIGTWIPA